MTARHWASPVRVPWSSTRLHRLRACISNLDSLSCIVTVTVTMSAGSSRHLSRFLALSTISRPWQWSDGVECLLPLLATATALCLHGGGRREAQDPRYGVAKPAQAVPVLALSADPDRRSGAVYGQCQPVPALAVIHVPAWLSCSRVDFHWPCIPSSSTPYQSCSRRSMDQRHHYPSQRNRREWKKSSK